MPSELLNDNQARHLTSVLGLLLDDLTELAADLPHDSWTDKAAAQIRDAAGRVRDLLKQLDLPLPERAQPRRRLLAYTSVWLARLHDLRSERLKGYGAVAPGLKAVLNPALEAIAGALERVGRLAREDAAP